MPKLREVLKGEKFGYRTALGESEKRGRLRYDKCQCECGTIKFVHHDHLIHGRSTNCGCKMYEVRSKNGKMNKKHGMEGTAPYKKFMAAKARCNYKNNDSYSNYGGRGIKMERKNFTEFWNDMGESYYEHVAKYGENETTLDRIDVNGNYCKDNCRWATREEQYTNKSSNHEIEYNGIIYKSMSLFCKIFKLNYYKFKHYIYKGIDIELAIKKSL